MGALALIAIFLLSSTVTELIGTAGDIHLVRQWIVLGLPVLIGCLAIAALSGRHLARHSRAAVIRRKQRRMQIVATAGIVVLVPCALVLDHLTASASAGSMVGPHWRSVKYWQAPSTSCCWPLTSATASA